MHMAQHFGPYVLKGILQAVSQSALALRKRRAPVDATIQ